MAAVDQHRQLDAGRSAVVHHGIHGGPDGAAGDRGRHPPAPPASPPGKRGCRSCRPADCRGPPVVPVQGDVDGAKRHINLFDLGNALLQLGGEMVAAGANADQRQLFDPLVAFKYFVGFCIT